MLEEAVEGAPTGDEVIGYGDAEDVARFLGSAGDLPVLLRRLESTRWVIMSDDHGSGVVSNCFDQNFPRINDRPIDGSDRRDSDRVDHVSSITYLLALPPRLSRSLGYAEKSCHFSQKEVIVLLGLFRLGKGPMGFRRIMVRSFRFVGAHEAAVFVLMQPDCGVDIVEEVGGSSKSPFPGVLPGQGLLYGVPVGGVCPAVTLVARHHYPLICTQRLQPRALIMTALEIHPESSARTKVFCRSIGSCETQRSSAI